MRPRPPDRKKYRGRTLDAAVAPMSRMLKAPEMEMKGGLERICWTVADGIGIRMSVATTVGRSYWTSDMLIVVIWSMMSYGIGNGCSVHERTMPWHYTSNEIM